MDHSEVKHFPKIDHTPAELDDASRLLLKAAHLIELHGFCKGIRTDGKGRHCVLGAIDHAGGHEPDGYDPNKGPVWKTAVERVEKPLGYKPTPNDYPGWAAATWNNASMRTGAEVIANGTLSRVGNGRQLCSNGFETRNDFRKSSGS